MTHAFKTSVCACALAMAAGFAAHAQTTETDETPETEDTLVVTGYRDLNTAAISAKREAVGVMDAVSQDQIGLLPDLTIGDVARRIPGLASVPASGGAGVRSLEGAEAVVIRGLEPSFNLTTFDGAPIASTSEDERAAKLSLFPPSVISRVEAVKTLTADLNPHGLSGQLNLVTTSAFDRDGMFGSTRFSLGQNSTAGEVVSDQGLNYRADGLFTNTFGANDQFGLVLSASYTEAYATTSDNRPGAETRTYYFYSADLTSNEQVDSFADSSGFAAARRNQLYLFENSQERLSLAGKLEYQPSEDTYASLFAGMFYQDEQETRHEHLVVSNPNIRPINHTIDSGEWTVAQVQAGFVYQPEESTTSVLTGTFGQAFGEKGQLDITASLSRADMDVIRNMSKFATTGGYSVDASFSYDMSGGDPIIDFNNPAFANDPMLQDAAYIRARTQDIRQDIAYLDASYGWNFAQEGFGFEIGANFTGRDQSFDREYIQGNVFNTDGCTEADITDCPVATLDQYALPNVFPSTDPEVSFYLIDDAAMRAAWAAQGTPITSDRTDNSINSDYTINEQIAALYGQATYISGPLSVRAGLRYDDTKTDIDVYARDRSLPKITEDADQYIPVSRTNDYSFWLPSLIASYDLTDDVIVRAAYGRTIGRANFSELARSETIGEPNEVGEISISRGNPDLTPLVSDNFDLSVEYYFDGGASMVSGAVFYKDVSDLIYTRTQLVNDFEYEGQTYAATITQPINATDSTIYGLELAARKDFASMFDGVLGGFIAEANVTMLDSDFTYINAAGQERNPGGWVNQPDLMFNAQLSWEEGPLGAKIAYNYVGDYLSNIFSDEGDLYDMYATERGVWDAQARYSLTDMITVIGEVQNIAEEGLVFERRFPNTTLLGTSAERGRVVWLGVSMTY